MKFTFVAQYIQNLRFERCVFAWTSSWEHFQSRSIAILRDLTKLLRRPRSCLSHHHSCASLGPPATEPGASRGLFLQPDSSTHHWRLAAATLPRPSLNNGRANQGPLGQLNSVVVGLLTGSSAKCSGLPRTHWRDYMSWLAWECLRIPAGGAGCGEGSLGFLAEAAAPTTQTQIRRRKWTNNLVRTLWFSLCHTGGFKQGFLIGRIKCGHTSDKWKISNRFIWNQCFQLL